MKGKIRSLEELKTISATAKSRGKKVVFTNGCFDILHAGHLHLLREARRLGDLLIVALNSDASVERIKGNGRPIQPEADRAELIAALEMVDYVTVFDQADPFAVIREIRPSVLVKGGDWDKDKIVGRELVEQEGGSVVVVPLVEGRSTSEIIERMRVN